MQDFKQSPFILTITSGKGGVGKSFLAANLAYTLSKTGLKTLIWDGDFNFPNQHLMIGVEPPIRLYDVYEDSAPLEKAIWQVDENLYLLSDIAASGKDKIIKPGQIIDIFKKIIAYTEFDLIIIDTPAGGKNEVLQYCNLADLVALVVTDEPTSLLDAYGMIKLILKFLDSRYINLLINNVIDYEDADEISHKMNLAVENFLNLKLDLIGFVPYDRNVRKSIIQQELLLKQNNSNEIKNSIEKVTETLRKKIEKFHTIKD